MAGGKLIVTKYNDVTLSIMMNRAGKALRINAQKDSEKSLIGNIYAGNVCNVVDGINGAFVEIEGGKMGFLRLDGKKNPIFLNEMRNPGKLRQGDIILVQAETDPQKMKEAGLSAEISIPGKYAVLVSGLNDVKISAKIQDKKEELARVIKEKLEKDQNDPDAKETDSKGAGTRGFGFIIRTRAAKVGVEKITADADVLKSIWEDILAQGRAGKKGLLFEAPDVFIKDMLEADESECTEVVTDDGDAFVKIKKYLEKYYPEDLKKIRMYNDTRAPFRSVIALEKIVSDAMSKKINLRSGGFLIIEPTEAMMVIDVNSGKSISGKHSGTDFLKINLEAAREVARQIQLRNLSGMILVDFISMKEKTDNDMLMANLKEYLKDDPMKAKVVDMTALGIVEITRKKVRRPLYEIMYI